MTGAVDWGWKLREGIDRIRTRYEYIGRHTGAPFLAIVYPPEAERQALREWHTLTAALPPELDIRTINVLEITSKVVRQFGVEPLVETIKNPMPGSDPEVELGTMWTDAVAESAREAAVRRGVGRPVVVLERIAALHPVSGPQAVMQALWERNHADVEGPVILLIPGVVVEAHVYRFVGQKEEFMYRGDLL